MNQDELNRQVIKDIIDQADALRKELSLEGHHMRLNHIENFMKFIQSDQFIEFIKSKIGQ
jgi:hypothetical protein